MEVEHAAPAPPKRRPIGVTILAILAILGAILFLIAGPTLLLGAGLISEVDPTLEPFVPFFQAIGAVMTVMGVLLLVGGIGLFKLAPWGWWLAVIAIVISLATSIAQVAVNPAGIVGSAPSLALAVIILIYLFVVRGHFGIGVTAVPPA